MPTNFFSKKKCIGIHPQESGKIQNFIKELFITILCVFCCGTKKNGNILKVALFHLGRFFLKEQKYNIFRISAEKYERERQGIPKI